MQILSSRPGSESSSPASGDNSNFEQPFDVSGIEDVSYLKLYLDSCKEDYKLISYVNSKVNILTAVKKQNIILQSTHKPDWAYKISCPFPDHRDSSPSFYINISTNTFHCFGCSRKGGVCQFLACLKGKQTIDIAKELIEKGHVEITDLVKEAQQSYNEIIFPYLDEFSKIHHLFLEKNNFSDEAFEFASNVAPVFELYVKNILKNNGLDEEALRLRLDFCKRKFEEFEET
jgi:hypothetical protein